MELTVECHQRQPGRNPNTLRREGLIPAVLYGHNGTESVSLTVEAKAAETLLKKASVNNTLINVNVVDLPWSGKTLLREVQTHPWQNKLYHLSFFSIASQASVEVTVPLSFSGDAVGVKKGGSLDTLMMELQVQCAPDQIPDKLDIDVSNLDIGKSLHVNELVLSEGVMPLGEQERIVVSVIAPRVSGKAAGSEAAS
ncbi:MAG: 50S ribosomal protein L25/general stress protein Ctc [Cyanothece sp. SIO1E1]|nr:50S ribosomal protein L25/general stress protein Ctc [Cyanothece sp. SIO1E1]